MTGLPTVTVIGHSRAASGAERVLIRYVDAMRAEGWRVRAVAPTGALSAELADSGVKVDPIPELGLPAGSRGVTHARMAARWLHAAPSVRRAASTSDLVVVNSQLALPALRAARATTPAVWLIHDVVTEPSRQRLVRMSRPALSAAVAVSTAAAQFPVSIGLPTRTIRNGTPWPVEPADPGPGRPVVGINAMVTPWKGHDVLLEAMAELPDLDLEIMGGTFPKDGPYLHRLQRRAVEGDLAGRVRFLGHVDDPLAMMRGWTVAVNASVDPEAAPLSVLEAMSLGLPTVATDHGGSPEVLGCAGILVEPGDPTAMRKAIAELATDRSRQAACARHGRRAIAAGLTIEQAERAFVDFLTQLLERDASRELQR